jgi:hypothetical protein
VATYTVGGTVSGLAGGASVTLQNNGVDDLLVSANGGFTFGTALADGSAYAVTVSTQPTGQTCSVSSGGGTLAGANVTTVDVNCVTTPVPTYTVGGTVSGLAGSGLVLQNNSGDDLSVTSDGGFTFATALADGTPYAVTVLTQPTSPNQTCSVTSGSGTLAGANVNTVGVACVTNTYAVGGTISGLPGGGSATLQNNGVDDLVVSADGSFTFPTALADGSTYDVTVSAPPAGQTCTVTNGSGTVTGGAVGNISISCATVGAPGAPEPIPTLNDFGLMALALLMLAAALKAMRRPEANG